MKLDKLIKDSKLFERLDKLDPDTTSKSKNDGINYWKGKKIVSLAEWRKIANSNKAFQYGIEHQRTNEALQYFPDDYTDWLFPLGVQQEHKEAANKWYLQYLELMRYRKNPKYGRTKCYRCLLSPDREEGGNYVGISRLVARGIEVKEDNEVDNYDNNTASTPSLYPCPVLNIFKCPYDRKGGKKAKQQKELNEEEEDSKKSDDIDYLFMLADVAFQVELAFMTAKEETSLVPINNVEDIYNALTDRKTFDKLLQQGLDEKYQKYKDKIVEFFMSIKDNVRIEDLRYYRPI